MTKKAPKRGPIAPPSPYSFEETVRRVLQIKPPIGRISPTPRKETE